LGETPSVGVDEEAGQDRAKTKNGDDDRPRDPFDADRRQTEPGSDEDRVRSQGQGDDEAALHARHRIDPERLSLRGSGRGRLCRHSSGLLFVADARVDRK